MSDYSVNIRWEHLEEDLANAIQQTEKILEYYNAVLEDLKMFQKSLV